MVASVPELTMRTFSTEGTQLMIFSAIWISHGHGQPKDTPDFETSWMMEVISIGAWPRMAGPHVPT